MLWKVKVQITKQGGGKMRKKLRKNKSVLENSVECYNACTCFCGCSCGTCRCLGLLWDSQQTYNRNWVNNNARDQGRNAVR